MQISATRARLAECRMDPDAVSAAATGAAPFCSGAVALERLLLHLWGVLLQQQKLSACAAAAASLPRPLLLQQPQRLAVPQYVPSTRKHPPPSCHYPAAGGTVAVAALAGATAYAQGVPIGRPATGEAIIAPAAARNETQSEGAMSTRAAVFKGADAGRGAGRGALATSRSAAPASNDLKGTQAIDPRIGQPPRVTLDSPAMSGVPSIAYMRSSRAATVAPSAVVEGSLHRAAAALCSSNATTRAPKRLAASEPQ
ncbi:putative conserved eukaryotic alpha beta related protein [Cyclospora cayetanensis]|uniref:Conserved eukaryotic alpha beta related protein n=1 Tax=Cyclospora cayetanensis TaxID=88456 RepID=A0A1D3D3K5_9EIME|nr:putative conserved eukaryotic alpha beta related protein [Cyclospora cayetanensis]